MPTKLNLPDPPATLPCVECGGQCCNLAAMSNGEYKAIRRAVGIPKNAVVRKIGLGKAATTLLVKVTTKAGWCPWLKEGACSIYNIRPQTCRDYGTQRDMPCMYLFPEASQGRMEEIMEEAEGG